MRYVFYTLPVYEIIYKAQLAVVLLLGGMGIWGNTWALVWSKIPNPLSLRCKVVPDLALCHCLFGRAGVSFCFSIITRAGDCGLYQHNPYQVTLRPSCSYMWSCLSCCRWPGAWWQLWEPKVSPGKPQDPAALPLRSRILAPWQGWPQPCTVPGGMC